MLLLSLLLLLLPLHRLLDDGKVLQHWQQPFTTVFNLGFLVTWKQDHVHACSCSVC
jgi:hypothetical protein